MKKFLIVSLLATSSVFGVDNNKQPKKQPPNIKLEYQKARIKARNKAREKRAREQIVAAITHYLEAVNAAQNTNVTSTSKKDVKRKLF